MYKKKFSKQFAKSISKLKGQEAKNLVKKIIEILSSKNINHYKNLRNDLKDFKRVHINSSFVILFKLDKKNQFNLFLQI